MITPITGIRPYAGYHARSDVLDLEAGTRAQQLFEREANRPLVRHVVVDDRPRGPRNMTGFGWLQRYMGSKAQSNATGEVVFKSTAWR